MQTDCAPPDREKSISPSVRDDVKFASEIQECSSSSRWTKQGTKALQYHVGVDTESVNTVILDPRYTDPSGDVN